MYRLALDAAPGQKFRSPPRRVELNTQGFEQLRAFDKGHFVLEWAGGQKNGLNRELESDRDERFEKGLLEIVPETTDLAGGGHFDPDGRVGPLEAGEREVRGLHPHI